MRTITLLFIITWAVSGCRPSCDKIKIIKYKISLDDNGKINEGYIDNKSEITITTNSEDIEKFEDLYQKVNKDSRYKCVGSNYVIEFLKDIDKSSRLLRVNSIDDKNQVLIINSDFNGYIKISIKDWNELKSLTK